MDTGAAVTIVLSVLFGSPAVITYIALRHRERMESIKHRIDSGPALREELVALRREMTTLRETTTKFDMSFDAALDRVEARLDSLENQRRTGSASAVPEDESTINALRNRSR